MPRKPTKDLDIGARIRVLRNQRGLRLEDLGDKVDLTWQQVQRIETGRAGLTAERLRLFAEVLGVSASDLVGENDPTSVDEDTRLLLFLRGNMKLDDEETEEIYRYFKRIKRSRK